VPRSSPEVLSVPAPHGERSCGAGARGGPCGGVWHRREGARAVRRCLTPPRRGACSRSGDVPRPCGDVWHPRERRRAPRHDDVPHPTPTRCPGRGVWHLATGTSPPPIATGTPRPVPSAIAAKVFDTSVSAAAQP